MKKSAHSDCCEDCSILDKAFIWLSRQNVYIQYLLKISGYFVAFWIFSLMVITILKNENNLNALYASAVSTTHLSPVYVGLIAAFVEILKIIVGQIFDIKSAFHPPINGALVLLTSNEIVANPKTHEPQINLSLCDNVGDNIYMYKFDDIKRMNNVISCVVKFIKSFLGTGTNVNIAYYRLLNTTIPFVIGRRLHKSGCKHKVYHREGCVFSAYFNQPSLSKGLPAVLPLLNVEIEILDFNLKKKLNIPIDLPNGTSIKDLSVILADIIQKHGGYDERTLLLFDSTSSVVSFESLKELNEKGLINRVILIRTSPKQSRRLTPLEMSTIGEILREFLETMYSKFALYKNNLPLNVAFKTPSAISHYVGFYASALYIKYRLYTFNINTRRYDLIYIIDGNSEWIQEI